MRTWMIVGGLVSMWPMLAQDVRVLDLDSLKRLTQPKLAQTFDSEKWRKLEMDLKELGDKFEPLKVMRWEDLPKIDQFKELEGFENLKGLAELKALGHWNVMRLEDLPLLAKTIPGVSFYQDGMAYAQSREAAERAREEKQRVRERDDRSRELYNAGTRSIEKRDYERAITLFSEVIERKAARADGAYYWKAYAQNRLGRRPEALATLSELEKNHPQSGWINDAKALAQEVRASSGQAVSPESEADEDLKIYALNAIMNSDPERAVPILDKVLKDPKAPPKIKEKALFVLAQSRDPKAKEILTTFAKGGSNPDIQLKAVQYLSAYGRDNKQILSDIYGSTNDYTVKREVIRGMLQSGDRERLIALTKSEQNADLKREAIRTLGAMGASAEIGQLYTSESSTEVKEEIIRAMLTSNNIEKLTEIANTERDANLRRSAIRMLGSMRRQNTGDSLATLYAKESEKDIKREISRALFSQGNAIKLVEIARKESDPEVKKDIVRLLGNMKSKEATDYMMEILSK